MQNILSEIVKRRTKDTYEAINISINVHSYTEDRLTALFDDQKKDAIKKCYITHAKFDIEDAIAICLLSTSKYASVLHPDFAIGSYIVSHYSDAFAQLKELISSINNQNIESRQFIVKFDKAHCFQSIQFLIREKHVIAICNMRSCNYIENFFTDAFIVGDMAQQVADKITILYGDTPEIAVCMHIGSLHIFRDKVDVV